jgi:hypothetical protein
MIDDTVTEFFERLSTGRVDAAWREFLTRYSSLIMHVIRRQCVDEDGAGECFVHVCGALSSDGFRKLISFRPDGPARFKTWLMAVVANLCVDWRRKEVGRHRPFKSVSCLSELDQQVYRCIYVRGMSREQCLRVLLPRFPELTGFQVSGINTRLFGRTVSRLQFCRRTARGCLASRAAVPREIRDGQGVDPEFRLVARWPTVGDQHGALGRESGQCVHV